MLDHGLAWGGTGLVYALGYGAPPGWGPRRPSLVLPLTSMTASVALAKGSAKPTGAGCIGHGDGCGGAATNVGGATGGSSSGVSTMSISSRSNSVRTASNVGNDRYIFKLDTMCRNLPLRPRRRVRTSCRSSVGSPRSAREAAIVSRWQQYSVMERMPCLRVRNSASSSRARNSHYLRNSSSR